MTKMSQQAKWNERFSQKGYAYGEEANEFLKSTANLLPKGRILCLGEGEGRNALFLAVAGYEVTAIDISDIGLEKTRKRAEEKNVVIHTIHADLREYDLGRTHGKALFLFIFMFIKMIVLPCIINV